MTREEMVETASEAVDEALEDVGSFVCESDRRIAASAVIDALRVVQLREALERIAEHAGSHTITADDPNRHYYGWGYVYDLARTALGGSNE